MDDGMVVRGVGTVCMCESRGVRRRDVCGEFNAWADYVAQESTFTSIMLNLNR